MPNDLELFRALSARRPFESELRGPSMGAAIPHGSRIRISPPPAGGAPIAGSVVAFLAGSRVMVHRIVYRGRGPAARGWLVTHGDANWMCDPPVEVGAVAGVVSEYREGHQWRPVGPPALSLARRLVSWPSLLLVCALLELSPRAAARLGRAMSYTRMGARSLWRRLVTGGAGNAGHP